MASTIQLRVDDDLKAKSDSLFKDLGTDTTTAIRIFLTIAVSVQGFPFDVRKTTVDPYAALSEDEILQKLERSRRFAAEGNYRNSAEVITDLRGKYGI